MANPEIRITALTSGLGTLTATVLKVGATTTFAVSLSEIGTSKRYANTFAGDPSSRYEWIVNDGTEIHRGDLWTDATGAELTTPQVSQAIRGTPSIAYVTHDGNDTTSGTTLRSTIQGASSGTLVVVGPGTFALANTGIAIPAGVSVSGAGMYATKITSTAQLGFVGAIIKPGTGSSISDLWIAAVHFNGIQAPYGADKDTSQVVPTYATVERVYMTSDVDGIYFTVASASPPACTITIRESIIETKFDAAKVRNASGAWADFRIDFYDCELRALGPSLYVPGTSRGISIESGLARFFGGFVRATDGGGNETTGISCESNGTVELHGTAIHTAASAGTALDLKNTGIALIVDRATYDAGKTSGAITVAVNHATESSNMRGTDNALLAANHQSGVQSALNTQGMTSAWAIEVAADAGSAATNAMTAAAQSTAAANDTAAIKSVVDTNLDAKVSTRATPGDIPAPPEGDGDIPVDHNTGGTDNLRLTRDGIGIGDAIIIAYLKSDYDAGNRTRRGKSTTGDDGRWLYPMMLDPGTYILIAEKPGVYKPDPREIEVSA